MSTSSFFQKVVLGALSVVALSSQVLADAPGPGDYGRKVAPKREAPPEPPRQEVQQHQEPAKEQVTYDDCEWRARLSPGVTVWFFDEEDTLPGANLTLDVWRTDIPLNFRVGVEGRHMFLGQDAAEGNKEFEDKTTKITYIRIPFALEYIAELAENTNLYLGGGPDIVHTANDVGDTSVGAHIGARVHQALDDHWGLAVEAGYMWGEVEGESGDIDLDGAYITPQVAYTF